jgi:hypothetical protein
MTAWLRPHCAFFVPGECRKSAAPALYMVDGDSPTLPASMQKTEQNQAIPGNCGNLATGWQIDE